MEKHLHIICLNVPYPVDYGGVFDLFYKLPALQQQGVKIHLHCFEYGRGQQPELNKYCESVHYYKRLDGMNGFSIKRPFIVSSRKNSELRKRLLEDDHPILMEGIHCTFLVKDKRLARRKLYVRLHNIEHVYYRHLFQSASLGFKKLYYWWESKLLFAYEKQISNAATFCAVSPQDVDYYKNLGCSEVTFLPLFLPAWKIKSLEGRGSFCLYQGDLSVEENQKSVSWLLKEVFNDIEIPFVIAGKDPSKQLEELVKQNSNCCLVANPNEADMQDMISKAHINVIPSFNATGIKLKLVNALYNGRHCVVNKATVEGTGLESACHIGYDATSFKALINFLYKKTFSSQDIALRLSLLNGMFNNEANAKQMVELIWN